MEPHFTEWETGVPSYLECESQAGQTRKAPPVFALFLTWATVNVSRSGQNGSAHSRVPMT